MPLDNFAHFMAAMLRIKYGVGQVLRVALIAGEVRSWKRT
jgi:hypothetical protein